MTCPNTGYNGNSDFDDESYKTSEKDSVGIDYIDIDDFLVSENAAQDHNSKYDSENLGDHIYSSHSNEDRPYLDIAYVDKIHEKQSKVYDKTKERDVVCKCRNF